MNILEKIDLYLKEDTIIVIPKIKDQKIQDIIMYLRSKQIPAFQGSKAGKDTNIMIDPENANKAIKLINNKFHITATQEKT